MRLVLTWLLLARAASADPIADREREAARLEKTYEKTYAIDALVRASALRAALGQRAKWIANVEHAVRLHPAKVETAVLVFELAMTSPAHLRLYLRKFAELGGTDRAVVAHAMLGEQLWQRSCSLAKPIDGLCARMLPPLATSCDRTRERWSSVPREPALARDGRAELVVAVRTFETKPSQDPAARIAYANAKRLLNDAGLEAFVARSFPKLAFTTTDASKRSSKRFDDWIQAQNKEGGKVTRGYEEVLALREPHAAIAAALRLGQQRRIYAAHIATSRLPHRLATGEFALEKHDAYCDRMREVAEPLDASAAEAFGVCAFRAGELNIEDAQAESCRRALEQLDPENFPAFGERVARPGPLPP